MTDNTGSNPAPAPEAAPAAPSTEPTNPAPESSPEPANNEPNVPEEGTPAEPTAPADGDEPPVAPATNPEPKPPRESAAVRRAADLRAKANGMQSVADKIDPPAAQAPAQPAPPPPPAAPPAQPAPNSQPEAPDYFDETDGTIDPQKLAAYTQREAARQVDLALAQRDEKAKQAAGREAIRHAVNTYADAVETDAKYLSTSVPELNPNDPAYDEDLDNEIEAEHREAISDSQGRLIRTDIPLKDFAMKRVERARRYKTAAAAKVPNTEAAAGMDTAMVPGGAPSVGGKSIDDMSAVEYEAYLKAKGVKTVGN